MSILDLVMGQRPNPTGMTPMQQQRMVMNPPRMAPIERGVPSVVNPGVQPAQDQSFLGRLGGGIMDYLSDPINRKQLALGFNAMRLNPDANFAQSLQSQIENEQAVRLLSTQGNRTAEALESAAQRESDPTRKNQLINAAQMVRENPAMAKEAAKLLFSASEFAPKGFGVRTDPETGQEYGVQYDPNTRTFKRLDIPGAIGETPTQKAKREANTQIELADYEAAREAGVRAFTQAETATQQIGTMYQAISAIDAGGRSGALDQFLPSFSAATSMLRNAATQMGIDIINSATFGALSETELRLALSSGIPQELDGPELKKHLKQKIEAQTKLRNELLRTAQELSAGKVKYSDFISKYQVKGGVQPTGQRPTKRWNEETQTLEDV